MRVLISRLDGGARRSSPSRCCSSRRRRQIAAAPERRQNGDREVRTPPGAADEAKKTRRDNGRAIGGHRVAGIAERNGKGRKKSADNGPCLCAPKN